LKNSDKFGKTLDLTVEKIVPGGFGLAFADNLTVFVSLAARGDRLRVRIREKKGKVAFAEIVEILKPSPDRTVPQCVYFGRCGGCDFQQLNYAAQLEAKVGIIRDSLTRIGKIEYEREIEIIGSPKPYGYRSRAQWHADSRRKKLGYFKRNSHEIIDVEDCPILDENLHKALIDFRASLEWENFWSETVEIEAASAGEQISVYATELTEPTREIFFEAFGEKYFYDAQSFFQSNQLLIEPLIETALTGASGENALDLYCGVGLFTLPLAKKFKQVIGVEASEKSKFFARENLSRAHLHDINLILQPVGEWLKDAREKLPPMDFVLLDPPRAGAEKETIESLLQIKPKQISYVSCDPATLARDLRVFCENFYSIESITAIDLFPQTHHVETVVRLKLKPSV
jgi:23S rRNA (uracil1939-C5)-methyltransferase